MSSIKLLFKRRKRLISVDILTSYAEWAKNYPATAHNPLMEVEQQAMLSLLPDNLSGRVCLDLACGSGRYMRLLHECQAKQVIGLDYSSDMLVQANNRHSPAQSGPARAACAGKSKIDTVLHSPGLHGRPAQGNRKLVRASFVALPFPDESFDFITCGLAVGHEKNLGRVLAESARVLHSGGVMLYSDFHPFATLLGWQRTFTADNGDIYELEHHLHLYENHQQACQAAGLTIDAALEPFAGPNVPSEAQNIPVVLVLRAVKTGS